MTTTLYRYMKAERAKTALATRQLRWSSPLLFNDPFDITQELRLNFDAGDLRAALNERLATLLALGDVSTVRHPGLALYHSLARLPADQRTALANKLREDTGPPTEGQASVLTELKDKWRDLVPTFRVLCLSERNDVTPMWHHYADVYKGVALEFSPSYDNSVFLTARPVVYQDEPPAIADPRVWAERVLSQTGYLDLFYAYQFVKSTSWSYEKEWRIVVDGARPGETEMFGDYGFNSRDLTGIYFGLKCSETDRADLLALLAHGLEHVQAYDTTSDAQQSRFTFHPVQHSSRKHSPGL